MQNFRIDLLLLTVIGLTAIPLVGCQGAPAEPTAGAEPVIVIAAFGTSVPEAQRNLEDFDTMVLERFPDYEVRWALTSQFIVKKLREAGQTTLFDRKVPLNTLEEVYAALRKEGKTTVAVQPIHVSTGQEFHEVVMTPVKGLNVRCGLPLLVYHEEIEEFAKVLSSKFGRVDTVTILCGHGNDHQPQFNASLVELDNIVREKYENVFVATVEGQPGTEQAFADVRASGLEKIKFVPLMIVAGDHIMNDVMDADDPESWRAQLGLEATAETGLGSNPAVMAFYLERLERLLSML